MLGGAPYIVVVLALLSAAASGQDCQAVMNNLMGCRELTNPFDCVATSNCSGLSAPSSCATLDNATLTQLCGPCYWEHLTTKATNVSNSSTREENEAAITELLRFREVRSVLCPKKPDSTPSAEPFCATAIGVANVSAFLKETASTSGSTVGLVLPQGTNSVGNICGDPSKQNCYRSISLSLFNVALSRANTTADVEWSRQQQATENLTTTLCMRSGSQYCWDVFRELAAVEVGGQACIADVLRLGVCSSACDSALSAAAANISLGCCATSLPRFSDAIRAAQGACSAFNQTLGTFGSTQCTVPQATGAVTTYRKTITLNLQSWDLRFGTQEMAELQHALIADVAALSGLREESVTGVEWALNGSAPAEVSFTLSGQTVAESQAASTAFTDRELVLPLSRSVLANADLISGYSSAVADSGLPTVAPVTPVPTPAPTPIPETPVPTPVPTPAPPKGDTDASNIAVVIIACIVIVIVATLVGCYCWSRRVKSQHDQKKRFDDRYKHAEVDQLGYDNAGGPEPPGIPMHDVHPEPGSPGFTDQDLASPPRREDVI